MRASYLQFAPEYLSVDQNRATAGELLAGTSSDLIVLPELFTSGYFFASRDDLASVAEPIPEGPTTDWLRDWADRLGATLVAGLAEQAEEAFYNSAVVAHPDGRVDVYRKVHLYYRENELFAPGNLGFPVVSATTRDGQTYRLGVMVCFDWYFPEAARTLTLNGADVIAHPSNLVLPHCPDAMPVRARENHVFTITANRHGREHRGDETLTFIGTSEICGPDGTILRRASASATEVETVEIDPHSARDRRINRFNDVLADRRPEAYAQSVEGNTPSYAT